MRTVRYRKYYLWDDFNPDVTISVCNILYVRSIFAILSQIFRDINNVVTNDKIIKVLFSHNQTNFEDYEVRDDQLKE